MATRARTTLVLPPLTTLTKTLIITIVGIFLLQVLWRGILGFDDYRYASSVVQYLTLSGEGVFAHGRVWTLLTHFWLSPMDSVFPVLFSALSLYLFGPPLEQRIGRTRTLVCFISAGIVGGLAALLVAAIAGPQSGVYVAPILGAQGATSGLVAALCWMWRDRWINVFLFRAKGWHLLAGLAGIQMIQGLLHHPISVAAPLGGLLMGMATASRRDPYALWQRVKLWRIRRRVRVVRGGKDDRDLLN